MFAETLFDSSQELINSKIDAELIANDYSEANAATFKSVASRYFTREYYCSQLGARFERNFSTQALQLATKMAVHARQTDGMRLEDMSPEFHQEVERFYEEPGGEELISKPHLVRDLLELHAEEMWGRVYTDLQAIEPE